MLKVLTSGLLEFLYVIYLISGFIKGYMIAYSFHSPVDITLLTAILLIAFIIIVLYKNDEIYTKFIFAIIFLLIFYVWMIFSSIYTSSEHYWLQKILYFLTNIIAFIFPLLVYKYFNIKRFFKYFIVLTILLNVYFTLNILPNIQIIDTFYQIRSQSLFVALSSGVNILLLIILKIKFKLTYLTLIVLLVNFSTLILSGSRGALIFTFITLILYFLSRIFNYNSFKSSIVGILKYFTVLIVLSISGLTYFSINNSNTNPLLEHTVMRLNLLLNVASDQDMGDSVNERFKLINFTLNKSFENLPHFVFGYGIGSFSIEYSDEDGRGYPHNIILEILFELGIIGLFSFLIFYIYIVKDYRYVALIWVVFYMTLNILKSSGLTDLRLFFAILSLMLINAINNENIINKAQKRI